MELNIIGIYLAAGKSSRMGQPKLSITLRKDEKLGAMALREALQSKLRRIIVVTRNGDSLAWLPEEYDQHEKMNRCKIVVCDKADLGLSYSLRSGIAAAQAKGADAVAVMLADQPLISAAMIDRLIAAYEQDPALNFVASGDSGIMKPPILWPHTMFPVLSRLRGDEGARSIMASSDYCGVIIEEASAYRFLDADTLKDIAEIKAVIND